jgi:CheY-like chemotaxis protein
MNTLLIVDDNEQNLYMLQVLLSGNGFRVEQASNGVEALERARRAPPDMIISDILMPVMDGFALCRAWKEDERLKNIPFVFYTATYTDPKDEDFALSLGADRFIIKPVEPDKFLALLLETRDNFEAGNPVASPQPAEEAEYYKHYNATLIRKLEDKMLQLEEANRILERDITERKQAEEALLEIKELFSLFMRYSPIYVYIKKVTPTESRVLQASDNFKQMIGIPGSEMIGKTMLELFPADFAAKITADDWAVASSGAVLNLEENFSGRSYTSIKFPIVREGSTLLAGYTIDITDRKKAEEERRSLQERLQRAEKMEALGTLAGGVAHDLNNVLGIVVGYSEMLLYDLDELSSAKSKAMEILKAGQRAAAMVQDLLTLTRRGVPGRKILNLNSIIIDCQKSPEFATVSSYHPNIRIKTDLEADLLNISGSSVHVDKSILNLVSNAVEAMSDGGTLTVRTSNQYLDKPMSGFDAIREGDYVVLSISDTGEGIPAADLKRIFEPFYTKKVMGRSGTGLGLAVVWGTVKDHHGYINVESEEGKGTTFTLYFPVTREEITEEEVAVSVSEYMGNGESILIVDDAKEQRDLATMMLTKLNYEVSSVPSGEEAVKYVREHTVDLVVLDMIMDPGMDGLDTYAKMLEIHPSQKAIIVSGFSETERVNKAQELGAGAYVKKPYILEKLGLAVRKELERVE